MTYTIKGTVWKDGVQTESFDLADATELHSIRDANEVLASYVITRVMGGGQATYSPAHDEFKIVMRDGSAEYIKSPSALDITRLAS